MSNQPPYSDFDDEPTMAPGRPQSLAQESRFPYPINPRYRCLGLLGQGSSGAVYKAFDSQLQREVAIKFIHRHEHEERTRLLNEGRLLAQLEHPNICKVFEVAEEDEAVYLVMSFINGLHLNVWREQFSTRQLVHIISDIAGALHSAHQQGIVHCDVKPSNIVLRQNDDAVLAVLVDFGIAHGGTTSATISGAGTQHYMAPERFSSGDNSIAHGAQVLTPAIDIYALGAALRFALTGSHEDNLLTLDDDLRRIIQHCMAAQAEDRYADAYALQQDLIAWLEQRPISLRRSPLYKSKRLWQRSRWFRATSISACALAVVTIVTANIYQNTLSQRQLEQLNVGDQVVQREYQIESIYRSPLNPVHADLNAIREDAERWYVEADSHPQWLAATHYAAAGRLFYQLNDNQRALDSLRRAWQLGDRSDRTATTYALTLKRFHFEATRQARTLPSAEAREQANEVAYRSFALPALDILDQAEDLQLPRNYITAMRLYFADKPMQALHLLRGGNFPHWFYQRFELMLDISDELANDVLDGYEEGDYLALIHAHEHAFNELTQRVPSYMPAYAMRAGMLFALQVGRENEHAKYRSDAQSWMDDVPQLLSKMALIDPNHPEFLFTSGRYHTLLSYRPHLTDNSVGFHLSNGARYLEQSLRYSIERDWKPAHQTMIVRGLLGHYINYANYLLNHNRSAESVLNRYQVVLAQLPEAYRGHNYYMNLGNAYAIQARQAETYGARNNYFQLADQAYTEGQKRGPELLALKANHARILNSWSIGQPLAKSIASRQHALDLITPVAERLPDNIAVLYNLATIQTDHANTLGLIGDFTTAASLLQSADQSMSRIIELSPKLDIARQRWSDIYLFNNHLLAKPLSPEARYQKIVEILSLDDFDPVQSNMSYARYLELLLQEHERLQQAVVLTRIESFINQYFMSADQHVDSHLIEQALIYLSLNTQDADKSAAWQRLAWESLKPLLTTELNELTANNSANILSAHLLDYLHKGSESIAAESRHRLVETCADSYDLFQQGYIKDVYLKETMRIWRAIGAHTDISCAAPEETLANALLSI